MTQPQHQQQTRVPDVAISLIRTWVPIGVGAIITWLSARAGFVIDATTSLTVGIAATAAAAAGYYGLARAFEAVRGEGGAARLARRLGRYMLGGLVSKPVYLTDEEYKRLIDATRVRPNL